MNADESRKVISADEARKITQESMKTSAVQALLKTAYGRIRLAAEKGLSYVDYPFGEPGSETVPSMHLQESAGWELIKQGYSVVLNTEYIGVCKKVSW